MSMEEMNEHMKKITLEGEVVSWPLQCIHEGEVYDCFSESHSLIDIARWLLRNPVDAEEVARFINEALAE